VAVVADPKFFEVSAQLLPVLVLAAAVETRLRFPPDPRDRHRAPGPWYLLRRLAMLAAISIGEITALVAVAGRPTALQTVVVVVVVVTVLGALGTLIIAPYLAEEADFVSKYLRQRSRPLKRVLAFLGALVATLPMLPSVIITLR
jgi:hypothetical protein